MLLRARVRRQACWHTCRSLPVRFLKALWDTVARARHQGILYIECAVSDFGLRTTVCDWQLCRHGAPVCCGRDLCHCAVPRLAYWHHCVLATCRTVDVGGADAVRALDQCHRVALLHVWRGNDTVAAGRAPRRARGLAVAHAGRRQPPGDIQPPVRRQFCSVVLFRDLASREDACGDATRACAVAACHAGRAWTGCSCGSSSVVAEARCCRRSASCSSGP